MQCRKYWPVQTYLIAQQIIAKIYTPIIYIFKSQHILFIKQVD